VTTSYDLQPAMAWSTANASLQKRAYGGVDV